MHGQGAAKKIAPPQSSKRRGMSITPETVSVYTILCHARLYKIPASFYKEELNMAAGQNVPELGGYEYEFTGEVPDDCECLVCQLPMKDPVQIVQCGHRLCNICMESLFS